MFEDRAYEEAAARLAAAGFNVTHMFYWFIGGLLVIGVLGSYLFNTFVSPWLNQLLNSR